MIERQLLLAMFINTRVNLKYTIFVFNRFSWIRWNSQLFFIASTDNGDDTILDFEDGYDLIDFSALSGTVDSFDDLTITQAGANSVVSFEGGSFTLNGVQTDTLTFNDFIFA